MRAGMLVNIHYCLQDKTCKGKVKIQYYPDVRRGYKIIYLLSPISF